MGRRVDSGLIFESANYGGVICTLLPKLENIYFVLKLRSRKCNVFWRTSKIFYWVAFWDRDGFTTQLCPILYAWCWYEALLGCKSSRRENIGEGFIFILVKECPQSVDETNRTLAQYAQMTLKWIVPWGTTLCVSQQRLVRSSGYLGVKRHMLMLWIAYIWHRLLWII